MEGNLDYKVCILAAGKGSRMANLSKDLHKAMLPLNNKPIISHIIEAFPPDIEIVIAVGYHKELLKQYLSVAHSERKITFVDVDNYDGPGSGAGYSMLQCKRHLQCPFILDAVDTIVIEKIPPPDHDWLGIAEISPTETERYCTVRLENDLVVHLDNKLKCNNKYAYIGLVGIYDYSLFWDSLESNNFLVKNESQVTNGFYSTLNRRKLHAINFTWYDTGTEQNYFVTAEKFGKSFTPLEKTNESIFFVNGLVVKYFSDKVMVLDRVRRTKVLEPFCPKITAVTDNFYAYKFVEGLPLSKVLNDPLFMEFLNWSNKYFWLKKSLNAKQKKQFRESCLDFYQNKTSRRIEQFYETTKLKDCEEIINGYKVPKLSKLMKLIDWDYMTDGIAVNFHGDYFIENIIYQDSAITSGKSNFVLIDWRQNFDGIIEYGDIYYDLAKLNHGIKISHDMIRKELYDISIDGHNISLSYGNYNTLIDCQRVMRNFVQKNGYDYKKVEILSALIYLNIAPLHTHPYGMFLYYLGKLYLHQILGGDSY